MADKQALRNTSWSINVVLGVLLFAVLVVLNYISQRHMFTRIDLTANQEYTVSEPTRRALSQLDDVVNVQAFLSRDLPEQAVAIPTMIRDLLTELEVFAHGSLRVDYLDPTSSPELESRVRELGIPKVPMMVFERNRQQTVEVYLGLAVSYGAKTEIIPAVFDNTNVEYELMSAILKVTRAAKTVGFLTGHGERDPYGDYRAVAEQLRRQHTVETVDLADGKIVAADVTTLVVAGPKLPLDEWSRYQIDQFLMRGGRALFLIDSYEIDLGQLSVRPIEHGLGDQLASYGVRVEKSLVADWGLSEVVQLPVDGQAGGEGRMRIIQYPLWPKLAPEFINSAHPIVNQIPTMVMPWTAPIQVVEPVAAGRHVDILASSTSYSATESQLYSANPSALTEPQQDQLQSYPLIAAITGSLTSYWSEREVPTRPAPAAATAEGEVVAPVMALPDHRTTVESTQLVVIGGSGLGVNELVQQPSLGGNLVFLLNAVDWLTSGEELLGIRSRDSGAPMLDVKRLQVGHRIAPFINLILVPAMVVLLGLLWRANRRSRRLFA